MFSIVDAIMREERVMLLLGSADIHLPKALEKVQGCENGTFLKLVEDFFEVENRPLAGFDMEIQGTAVHTKARLVYFLVRDDDGKFIRQDCCLDYSRASNL